MKKVFAFMLCIGMLIMTTATVFADVPHFDDGHHTITLDEYGISMEIPKNWAYMQMDEAYVMYPAYPETDLLYLLSFTSYEEDDLHDTLKTVFLTTAADKSLTGMTGEDQQGASEIMELTNGNEAAAAFFADDDDYYTIATTVCGQYIIIFGYKIPIDKYEDEYIDDLDLIISSAEEIER